MKKPLNIINNHLNLEKGKRKLIKMKLHQIVYKKITDETKTNNYTSNPAIEADTIEINKF